MGAEIRLLDLPDRVFPAEGLGPWDPAAGGLFGFPGPAPLLKPFLEGIAHCRLGRPRQALELFARARAAGIDCAALHWWEAYSHDALGERGACRRAVEEAFRRFSEPRLEYLLGPAMRREALAAARAPTDRVLRLLSAAARGPKKPWALVCRAETLRRPEFSRYPEALADLALAARLEPRSPWIAAYYGRALDGAGRAEQAGAQLRKAAKLDPACGWIAAWFGQWLRRHGRPRDALASLEKAKRLAPEYPFARAWLGGCLRELGRFPEAQRELEVAVVLEPGYEWSHAELFETLRARGRLPEAAEALARCHCREPKFVWARPGQPQALESGLKEIKAALRARPGHEILRAWGAWCALSLGRAEEARGLLPPRPRSGFALLVLGLTEARLGRAAAAERALSASVAADGGSAALSARGAFRLRRGDYRGAAADLERSLRANGTQAGGWFSLGLARLGLRREETAREAVEHALRLQAGYADALGLLAELESRAGREDQARRLIAEAERGKPGGPWAALAGARLGAASAATLDRSGGDGLPPFYWTLADARGLFARGKRLLAEGDAKTALESFTRALRLEPTLAWAEAGRAAALEALGNPAAARAALARARRLDPSILSRLGLPRR